jgi:hypothetical protein
MESREHWSRARKLLTAPAVVLACVSALGCGAHIHTNSSGNTTGPSATAGQPYRFGEYDGDDGYYYKGRSSHDGDYDDAGEPLDEDGDFDSSQRRGGYDKDDLGVTRSGRAANPGERRAIAALVRSYYVAAAAENGAAACLLIDRPLAENFPRSLAGAGPSYLRGGKTCSGIMSKLFAQNHLQMAAYSRRLKVSEIRLKGRYGVAVLEFGSLPRREIELFRDEHGSWKLYAVVDRELP